MEAEKIIKAMDYVNFLATLIVRKKCNTLTAIFVPLAPASTL